MADRAEPFVSRVRARLAGRTAELERLAIEMFARGLSTRDIDTKTVRAIIGTKDNGNPEVVLNFITPHQKWGIHSTYTDNLLMLTLSRGGPIIWVSEADARKVGIEDNDWVEAYNVNGALVARAVVSQRIPQGTTFMYHAQEKMTNVPGSEIPMLVRIGIMAFLSTCFSITFFSGKPLARAVRT